MRGLIYKEVQLFFRSIDKKLILLAAGIIVLLLVKAGVYSGLLATVMLAMTISMQNVMSFASDEKADWKKYQLALPVSNICVVASKYISVLCTLIISSLGGILFCIISGTIYSSFNITLFGLSVLSAIIVPLVWTGICLPLTYWFGFHSAQTMGLIVVIPIFFLIKYFEDGPGLSALPVSLNSYIIIACITALVTFALSFIISILGYVRKR
ncbi:MAG: ABC-2 transporter permease [Lachnospiraceae bacterium]|nr:ABC-2 transporter permease [Lachnospiraceae bacterium]